MDKRSVQKYMKQQEKEAEPINNAFADLLKGLKLEDFLAYISTFNVLMLTK